MSIDLNRNNKRYNLKIFETIREEIVEDVEITEAKKPKEMKEDPRLAMMRKKKAAENAWYFYSLIFIIIIRSHGQIEETQSDRNDVRDIFRWGWSCFFWVLVW